MAEVSVLDAANQALAIQISISVDYTLMLSSVLWNAMVRCSSLIYEDLTP